MDTKLKLNATTKISLTDGTEQNIGDLQFYLKQFKPPKQFLFLANEVSIKAEKECPPL
ncbi:hypothetical protein [Bacillus cereus group sp. BfR-BA-01523]|uniref:hypothetical protein n=1 Tax=Bacillus cereus group sp. BfR-BA-01523 TaxID=2920371 RepID=UPI001F56B720|nr:hypothetical protein [Bacillus cereus group sp. BfR-BA-01523]